MSSTNDQFKWLNTPHGVCPVYSLLPEEKPASAVIFCHGYTGCSHENNRLFWRLSRALATHGIASIRFDYNGFGNSSGASSEFTVQSAIDDTIAVLQDVAARDNIDADSLGLFGFSMGGRIAAYVLGNAPELKAGILCNAVSGHWKSIDELNDLHYGYDGDTTWDGAWEMPKSFFSVKEFGDGAKDIIGTKAEILVINGTDDMLVSPKTGNYYMEQLGKSDARAEQRELFGGDHDFNSPESSLELIDAVVNFYRKTLKI